MGRNNKIIERARVNVWILNNQVRDMAKIKENTGKTTTKIIGEALATYLAVMRKEGIL